MKKTCHNDGDGGALKYNYKGVDVVVHENLTGGYVAKASIPPALDDLDFGMILIRGGNSIEYVKREINIEIGYRLKLKECAKEHYKSRTN